MRRILFVDDDPLVVFIYKEAISKAGFEVESAADGMSATAALHARKPDLMVLDLMMPRLGGEDVLKFVRSRPELAELPIIVLSNSFAKPPEDNAGLAPARKALLKVRCTPTILLHVIQDLLESSPLPLESPAKVPVPQPITKSSPPAISPLPAPAKPVPAPEPVDVEFRAKARQHFLQTGAASCAALREAFQAFARAKGEADREVRLENLYRKVHFLAAGAGLADCQSIARMASAFEAMLFELTNNPLAQSPSILRTVAATVDFFEVLFQRARAGSHDEAPSAKVLVVDDDAISNRLVVSGLRRAQIEAHSTEDPLIGLECLRNQKFDLVLLDIVMPELDGFELCKQIREFPGYEKTPVIYITGHNDFETRAKSALSGGDDLIAKPVFPMELAVKAMTHLLNKQATKSS